MEIDNGRGRLKIFFGYSTGVGKTYAMLDDAKEQYLSGVDVVAGYIKPTASAKTIRLLEQIPRLSTKAKDDNNGSFDFDLDAALLRKPKLIIVDELARSNEIGTRNKKRYQDIEELLNAGIDVYTTVNVQNIESLYDTVQIISPISEQETVPDYIFDDADKVELIDIEPDELLRRLEEEKLHLPNEGQDLFTDSLTKDTLRLLREVAMRKAADRISNYSRKEGLISDNTGHTKILVCISCSPSSARCIRWTARTAEAFHAPWLAVYVENSKNEIMSEEEKRSFQANVELAEQLGAEVTTLHGQDIAATVAAYARISGITNIVIGKSRRKKGIRSLFSIDLEDSLIALLNKTEIHIIPDSPNSNVKSYHGRRKVFSNNRFKLTRRDTLKTLFILCLTTFVAMLLFRIDFSNHNIILLYILAILIVSKVTTGYLYGIAASIISVLIDNILFIEPKYSLGIMQNDYFISIVVMFVTALITSTTTVRIKAQVDYAESREQRIEVLYEINKKLLVTRGLDNILNLTNQYIVTIFGRSVIFYIKDPIDEINGKLLLAQEETDASFLQSIQERRVAHWVFVNQKQAGSGTDTLAEARAYYMPVIFQGNVLGVLGISCSNGLRIDQSNRAFMKRITSLVAIALERQRLSDEQRAILIETEKEKLRSNLLRAISHDLRTPLTGILGASSAILENKGAIDDNTKEQLVSHIKEDSQWLIRMVENLLSVTRINEDTANVTKTPEAAEEIIASAIGRIRKRFPQQKIDVRVPEELLMVPMDGTLIEQVIINLIENAIKHSGETLILVSLQKEEDFAVFEVSDNGDGIPEQDFPYLFESYVPNGKRTSDSSRGMGIGLSICMSIVKAHHGKIEAFNREGNGALFRFILPL